MCQAGRELCTSARDDKWKVSCVGHAESVVLQGRLGALWRFGREDPARLDGMTGLAPTFTFWPINYTQQHISRLMLCVYILLHLFLIAKMSWACFFSFYVWDKKTHIQKRHTVKQQRVQRVLSCTNWICVTLKTLQPFSVCSRFTLDSPSLLLFSTTTMQIKPECGQNQKRWIRF